MKHPCVVSTGVNFVANDTLVGSIQEDHNPNVLLITGPNMGGKSTLIR